MQFTPNLQGETIESLSSTFEKNGMMKIPFYVLLFFMVAVIGCTNHQPYGNPVVAPEVALNSKNFTGYWRMFLNLAPAFTAFDSSGKEISKVTFLQRVATGNYLPLRLSSDSGSYYYKLYRIQSPIDDFTKYTLMGMGSETYKQYLWEGKELPDINLRSLDGKVYNRETMKGKTVLIDFWFIGCTYCVQEMPKLNRLADSLKNKNILFASIAFDPADSLRNFLKKTDFHFDVISDTTYFLNKALGVRAYPTKVIVGKDGKIIKIIDDPYHEWENLMAVLRKVN